MKRAITTIAATIALIAGMTACTVQPVETPEASKDHAFLTVVRQEIPDAGEEAIRAAHAACDAFDSGATVRQVLNVATDYLTLNEATAVIGAGVGAYCPEHMSLFEK